MAYARDLQQSPDRQTLAPIHVAGYPRCSLRNEPGVTDSGQATGPAFFLSDAAVTALAWLRAARKRCWAPCLVSPEHAPISFQVAPALQAAATRAASSSSAA